MSVMGAVMLQACATHVCDRKARFLGQDCAGVLAVSIDPYCKNTYEKCSDHQKQQMQGYVKCLEKAGVCSLEVMNACREQFPAGVNLSC
ncbi:MAG: hypothetical protein KTR25_20675 [Myxococcales bacterium]|nr:hypothetical protein [Myxococcales bacterium]